ncbi:hypothetical protein [Endozoicomonas sp. 8E]|uniref:hypothetical protein n=1 Tax=Endozoicomonas sp. 8E TaxID=3035692 RepID=UPI002938E118|nr:hypothetical protein [Endozoicomonas sp. 8E]WOG26965.1 hypothetical protein P6910_20805 [Endozoicomonas sp. 8E]
MQKLLTVFNPDGRANEHASMPGNLPANTDDWIIIEGLLDLGGHGLPEAFGIFCKLTHSLSSMLTSETRKTTTRSPYSGRSPSHLSPAVEAQNQPDAKSRLHTGQRTRDMTVIGQDGRQRPCGRICKNDKVLSDHKRRVILGKKPVI